MAQATLTFAQTTFVLGLGSRGARAELPGTVTVDATKVDPAVNSFCLGYAYDILLRQASNVAEQEQIDEWKKAHPKAKVPLISDFPFDLERLRKRALEAMQERVAAWYNGDLGRDGMAMNAVDRRAATLIQAGLRARFAKENRKVPLNAEGKEDWSSLVSQALAHPVTGQKFRATALAQLDAERKAAEGAGDELTDFLPTEPTKPAAKAKAS